MPGVGKTSLGQYAANALKCRFIDLDEMIETEKNLSIAEIFEKNGESAFRLIEMDSLQKLIKTVKSDTIIATGGGTPCYNNSISIMKNSGIVVWLDADLDFIYENLNYKNTDRPLLKRETNQNLKDKLKQLLQDRLKFYTNCHIKLNVYRGLSPDLFTNRLHLSTFAKRA